MSSFSYIITSDLPLSVILTYSSCFSIIRPKYLVYLAFFIFLFCGDLLVISCLCRLEPALLWAILSLSFLEMVSKTGSFLVLTVSSSTSSDSWSSLSDYNPFPFSSLIFYSLLRKWFYLLISCINLTWKLYLFLCFGVY